MVVHHTNSYIANCIPVSLVLLMYSRSRNFVSNSLEIDFEWWKYKIVFLFLAERKTKYSIFKCISLLSLTEVCKLRDLCPIRLFTRIYYNLTREWLFRCSPLWVTRSVIGSLWMKILKEDLHQTLKSLCLVGRTHCFRVS